MRAWWHGVDGVSLGAVCGRRRSVAGGSSRTAFPRESPEGGRWKAALGRPPRPCWEEGDGASSRLITTLVVPGTGGVHSFFNIIFLLLGPLK